MYTVLIKLIEKNVQTLYFLASGENQACYYLIAHVYKMLWISEISFQSMEENLLINYLLSLKSQSVREYLCAITKTGLISQ